MVGAWKGLNLGSIPNFFPCFGMHPKITDVHPKLIPKEGVVQFCLVQQPDKTSVPALHGGRDGRVGGDRGGLGVAEAEWERSRWTASNSAAHNPTKYL